MLQGITLRLGAVPVAVGQRQEPGVALEHAAGVFGRSEQKPRRGEQGHLGVVRDKALFSVKAPDPFRAVQREDGILRSELDGIAKGISDCAADKAALEFIG